MALQHPSINITTLNNLTHQPTRENLTDRLHYIILQEETRQVVISCHKIAYKHRHIAKGKGYQLTEKRQVTLAQHLQTKSEELHLKTQKIERQWVFALSQGLLATQPPQQLIENLLMRKLQQGNPTFLQLSKELFELSLWLKRQTVAYQQTWEGQRLSVIIQLLQFREVA